MSRFTDRIEKLDEPLRSFAEKCFNEGAVEERERIQKIVLSSKEFGQRDDYTGGMKYDHYIIKKEVMKDIFR